MANYQETELMTEEIDLLNILKGSKKTFNKWKKIILVFLSVGIIGGVAYFIFSPRIYKSRMYLTSTLLKGTSFVVIVDDLQRHLKEQNYTEMGRLLNMDSAAVSKIQNIHINSVKNFAEKEFSNVITQEETDKEEVSETGEFIIEAFVEDNKILAPLEKGLVYYLNNNEYIKRKSIERRQNLRSVKDKVHLELVGLDSLKNSLSNIYSGTKKVGSSNFTVNDPSAIYNNIIGLYQAEINAEVELNSPDISVIQGFIIYKKPFSPKLSASVLTGLTISLILALIYISFKEFSNRVLDKI